MQKKPMKPAAVQRFLTPSEIQAQVSQSKWEKVDFLGGVEESHIYQGDSSNIESFESRTESAHQFLNRFNIDITK